MINKDNFRLKKNGEPGRRCYCRNPELIENYDKAMADETQTWEVHHRLECCFTYKFLNDMNLYYDVEPEALIFLTAAEHRKIDSFCKRNSEAHKGNKHSDEHKRKIGESNKGRKKPEGAGKPPKKVLCVETGEIFESMSDAQRKTGIDISHISKACNGEQKTTGGYHWRNV